MLREEWQSCFECLFNQGFHSSLLTCSVPLKRLVTLVSQSFGSCLVDGSLALIHFRKLHSQNCITALLAWRQHLTPQLPPPTFFFLFDFTHIEKLLFANSYTCSHHLSLDALYLDVSFKDQTNATEILGVLHIGWEVLLKGWNCSAFSLVWTCISCIVFFQETGNELQLATSRAVAW